MPSVSSWSSNAPGSLKRADELRLSKQPRVGGVGRAVSREISVHARAEVADAAGIRAGALCPGERGKTEIHLAGVCEQRIAYRTPRVGTTIGAETRGRAGHRT